MQGKKLYFDSLGEDNLRVILLSVMKLVGRFGNLKLDAKIKMMMRRKLRANLPLITVNGPSIVSSSVQIITNFSLFLPGNKAGNNTVDMQTFL